MRFYPKLPSSRRCWQKNLLQREFALVEKHGVCIFLATLMTRKLAAVPSRHRFPGDGAVTFEWRITSIGPLYPE